MAAPNQEDGFIRGIRHQVGGRHWAEKVLPEGGQGRFEQKAYHSRGGVTMSVTGTKRNCRGADGISAAEGRPAVPSTSRRQPSLTQSCRFKVGPNISETWKTDLDGP